jgi:hypothetical protein
MGASVAVGGSLVLLLSMLAPAAGAAVHANTVFGHWTSISNTSRGPPTARQAFGMAYDPDIGAVVVFGGQNAGGGALGDTWEWASGHWHQISAGTSRNGSPAHSPSARWAPGLVYDPALHGVLLFGGQNGYISYCGASCAFSDTWLFDAKGWHRLSPSASPPAMSPGTQMVYDSLDHYVFLRSTVAGAIPMKVVYSFANGTWTNLTSSVSGGLPSGVFWAADDIHDGYVLLFGNSTWTCTGTGATWAYHAGVFTNLGANSSKIPTAYMGSGAIGYDPLAQAVVMTGGYTASCQVVDQTWMFHNGKWSDITSRVGTLPGRWDSRLVFDAALQADFTFSGNEAMTGGWNSFGSDTWMVHL